MRGSKAALGSCVDGDGLTPQPAPNVAVPPPGTPSGCGVSSREHGLLAATVLYAIACAIREEATELALV